MSSIACLLAPRANAFSRRKFSSFSLLNLTSTKHQSSTIIKGYFTYGKNLLHSNRNVQMTGYRTYSSATAHSTSGTSAPVAILESLTQKVDMNTLSQEKMLTKLDDLIKLPDTFAVVHIGGKQYKVTENDQIMIETIDVPVNTQIILDKVLLLGSKEYTIIGQPLLPAAKVVATIEEHDKSEKVIIFKKKRRKTYQRKSGHRQPYTLLRINGIMGAKKAPL